MLSKEVEAFLGKIKLLKLVFTSNLENISEINVDFYKVKKHVEK